MTPNNLLVQLTSFVGREKQLAELRRLLRKSRLVTLTGPGGCGKTRLALHLAADVLDRHPDGVWVVELATVIDARLLEQTVGSACGVQEGARRSMLEMLVAHLGAKRTLLVLDGCEHLVDPCAALAAGLLRACPKLTLVVTSTEPLGVPGEVIWRTPSLSLPRLEDGSHLELVLQSEAVRLYVDRARLSQPGFDLVDPASVLAVAQICTRLEGMPLAIELAASHTRVMTAQEILERLRDRFRLLTGGSQTALPRHQTLRQAVDWSYGLLSPAEKTLVARLSLFSGGFDIEAADAMAQDEPFDQGGVMPVLSRLVDKSLVSAETVGTRTRYRMLESIREYALQKLVLGEDATARRLMTDYYVEYCGQAATKLRGTDPLKWLKLLDQDQANIRSALGWSLVERPDDALRLAAAMGVYWHLRRRFAEGAAWLDQALELATNDLAARALALWSRARIRWWYGDYEGAKRDAQECADLCRRLDMPYELGGALSMLGLVSGAEGDDVMAERFHKEALQLARRMQDPEAVARSLNNLGLSASARGDHQSAITMIEEAVSEIQKAGDRAVRSNILDSLARINLLIGNLPAARVRYTEALESSMRFGDTVYVAECLEGLALLAVAEGDAGRALTLIASAAALWAAAGSRAMPDWKRQVDQGAGTAAAKLGPQATDAARRLGAAMSAQQAVRYAIGASPASNRDEGNPLTIRETQVATLIAEGLTSGEIAERLSISARTADAHVEHMRNKLGLRTRAQIAIWAHERLTKI